MFSWNINFYEFERLALNIRPVKRGLDSLATELKYIFLQLCWSKLIFLYKGHIPEQ